MFRIGQFCPKCDRSGCDDGDIWCRECQKKHTEEYRSHFNEWFEKNRERLLREMGVPPLYQTSSFGNFVAETAQQRRVLSAVKGWVASDSRGIFLCGTPGTGKTHLAVAAIAELRRRKIRARFASVRELLLECRNSFRNDEEGPGPILARYTEARTLLLDDLGAENATEFSREIIETIIDRVYRDEDSLVVTSNVDLDGISGKYGVRVADRLLEVCTLVKFGGESYRKTIAMRRVQTRVTNAEIPQ
jgi:DNA replication protein DnaC